MCMFAGPVTDVSTTNLFARVSGDREHLVYEMTFSSNDQTAMILPIPTASAAADEAVEFVALDNYPDFFSDLERHFRQEVWAYSKGGKPPRVSLKVHLVGAFEASFVPGVDHFDRLDARFRIPGHVWEQLPEYASYGFVVFKLQPGRDVKVHPMAFSFRTRDPGTLFFPTLHIHDGMLHEKANFDHIFYTQNEPRREAPPIAYWMPSRNAASRFLRVPHTHRLVDGDAPCFQASLVGSRKNSDILIPI